MKEKEQMYLEVIKAYQAIMVVHLEMVLKITKMIEEGFTEDAVLAIMRSAEIEVQAIHSFVGPATLALKLPVNH